MPQQNALSSSQNRTFITCVVCSAFFMELLDATALNTSLPQIARSLGHNPIDLRSIIIYYLLAVGLLLPASAFMIDRFGSRRIFMSACAIFTLGSITCGLANQFSSLMLGRIIQGVGGAFLAPCARMLIVQLYPKHELVKGQALGATIASLGLMLGPVVGGTLTSLISWHAIFFINIPIGAVAILAAYRNLPRANINRSQKFDLYGFLYLSIATGTLLEFINNISSADFSYFIKLMFLLISIFCYSAYARHSRRSSNPLFNRELWKQINALRLMLLSFSIRISMLSVPFLVPILLQASYGFSAWHAGCMLLILAIGFGLVRTFIQKLYHHIEPRQLLSGALLLAALLVAGLTWQAYALHPAWLALNLLLFGMTQSLSVNLCNINIYQSISKQLSNQLITVNSSVIQLGACFSITLASLLLILSGHRHPDAVHLVPARSFRWVFCYESFILLAAAALVFFKKVKLRRL